VPMGARHLIREIDGCPATPGSKSMGVPRPTGSVSGPSRFSGTRRFRHATIIV